MACEDFPCCGHDNGDCPNPNPRKGDSGFRCVGCGKPLRTTDRSSFCSRKACTRHERKRMDQEYMYPGSYDNEY